MTNTEETMSDDKNRLDLTDSGSDLSSDRHTNVHIKGFYGDSGENVGVLSISANRRMTPHYPETAAIAVGSPRASPLQPGYIPNLGCFNCSVEAAKRLIAELQAAVAIVEAGMQGGSNG